METLVPMQLLAAANAVAQRCCTTAPNVAFPVHPKHANCMIMFGRDVFEKFIVFCMLWRPFVWIHNGWKSHAETGCPHNMNFPWEIQISRVNFPCMGNLPHVNFSSSTRILPRTGNLHCPTENAPELRE